MSTKMNLWSLTLVPGEKIPIYIRHDFTITNAALGEELRSTDGRSVVKVTHHPLPPHFGEDSDSEIDSDIDIDDEEDDSEEEFELDQEEGFKLTPKKGKAANGDAMEEEDEEDEDELDDEEDSDDEDDEDFDDDEPVEETNVICALTAGRIEQASLNLTFIKGDAVMFEVTGENAVHLMGNYIYQGDDSDDESDYDSEIDDYDMYGSDLEGEEESDEEEAPVGKITEVVEPKKKVAAAPVETKKRKAEVIDSPAPAAAAAAAGDVSVEGLSKAQQKKLAKKARRESEGSTAAPVAEKKVEKVQEKKAAPVAEKKQKKLASGLIIEDAKVGNGPVAKPGKRLSMRYVGKLESGKQFDANTGGAPFSFVLGRGEVIKGWDEGLAGMAVGGERKLTIPANLAYGNQKIPGIPKNSTLLFDVKLLAIK